MSKRILITGASSGFGLLIARTQLQQGHMVFATMREPEGRNATMAQQLHEAAQSGPGTLHVLELDVTSDSSVQAAAKQALQLGQGGLDVLVQNAGVGAGGLAEAFTPAQLRQLFEVNVVGVQRVARALLPTMRRAGDGLVLFVSSIMGRLVIPFAGAYTASKWALEGLAETYRYELAPSGVDVSIVEPGGFMTGFGERMMLAADEETSESCAEVNTTGQKLWGGFMETLASDGGPDPQLVADAVQRLIETPRGERPLRVVVDPMTGGEGPKALNGAAEQVQSQMLGAFGLSRLLSVKG